MFLATTTPDTPPALHRPSCRRSLVPHTTLAQRAATVCSHAGAHTRVAIMRRTATAVNRRSLRAANGTMRSDEGLIPAVTRSALHLRTVYYVVLIGITTIFMDYISTIEHTAMPTVDAFWPVLSAFATMALLLRVTIPVQMILTFVTSCHI